MALNRKASIAIGTIGVIAIAGAIGGLVLMRSDGSNTWLDPASGTYADPPAQAWEFPLDDPDADLLFTTDRLAILREEWSGAEKIIGIDLETGEIAWRKAVSDALCGASGAVTYDPTSAVVACYNVDSSTVLFLSAENGAELGTESLVGSSVHIHVSDETVYTCAAEPHSSSIRSGSALDLSSNFAVDVDVRGSIACDLSIEDGYVAGSSVSDDWVTVIGPDGEVTYQSFSRSGRFRGSNLLTTVSSEDFRNEHYALTVIELNGKQVYEYTHPTYNVFRSPGRRLAEFFIEDLGDVRDRLTGETLWHYDKPDEVRPLGVTGSTFIVIEDASWLRAFDVETGIPLWARSEEQFHLNGRPPSDTTQGGGFRVDGPLRSFAGDEETILITTGDLLTALGATTGDIAWTLRTSGFIIKQHQDYLFLKDEKFLRALHFS